MFIDDSNIEVSVNISFDQATDQFSYDVVVYDHLNKRQILQESKFYTLSELKEMSLESHQMKMLDFSNYRLAVDPYEDDNQDPYVQPIRRKKGRNNEE